MHNHYECRDVEITFRTSKAAPGRGWDHWADSDNAEVLGGQLELSHGAARQLAEAILQFLDTGGNRPRQMSKAFR